jgi:hypothetical protein
MSPGQLTTTTLTAACLCLWVRNNGRGLVMFVDSRNVQNVDGVSLVPGQLWQQRLAGVQRIDGGCAASCGQPEAVLQELKGSSGCIHWEGAYLAV